jgi:hypothetical protein
MPRRTRKQRERFVSAKDLAEMGFCEKRVLLAHRYGQRMTSEQQRRAARGQRAHQQYYFEGLAATAETGVDRRCFVATCLFGGEAWQTIALRRYRDEVLQRTQLGRLLVAAYYEVSPRMCCVLAGLPWIQRPVRTLVGMLASAVRRGESGSV